MASRSPWTLTSRLSLNSTVLTVEPGETEPTAKLPAEPRLAGYYREDLARW